MAFRRATAVASARQCAWIRSRGVFRRLPSIRDMSQPYASAAAQAAPRSFNPAWLGLATASPCMGWIVSRAPGPAKHVSAGASAPGRLTLSRASD